jgi:hypothetical protein
MPIIRYVSLPALLLAGLLLTALIAGALEQSRTQVRPAGAPVEQPVRR